MQASRLRDVEICTQPREVWFEHESFGWGLHAVHWKGVTALALLAVCMFTLLAVAAFGQETFLENVAPVWPAAAVAVASGVLTLAFLKFAARKTNHRARGEYFLIVPSPDLFFP